MTALRVVHLDTEKTWRGGERQVLLLARELRRRGHHNWVACRPGSPLDAAARREGLDTLAAAPCFEADLWAARRLRVALRATRAEVLHAHTGHATGQGALACLGTSVRLAATRRVDFPLGRGPLSRWKHSRVDVFAAISGRVRERLLEAGVPPDRAPLVPSGIDPSGYPSSSDRARWRAAKGLAADEVLFVQAAALVPHKGQDVLLRAAARVCREIPAARFLLLGEGPLRRELERTVADLGLAGRVLLPGHRDDVLEYVAAADVFVFSSVEEGLGTSLLDAMAVGVPTVAARAGGVPDLYGSPAAPELVPPGDDAALAAALLALLRDPEEAARRVARGRERVKEFTASAMAGKYEKIYERLLDR
jgi:glycosyltransferase involved in cell wall biosynthesis